MKTNFTPVSLMTVIILFLSAIQLYAQVKESHSIHMEESIYYGSMQELTTAQYDCLNQIPEKKAGSLNQKGTKRNDVSRNKHSAFSLSPKRESLSVNSQLNKRVFGYHPYWTGSAWQNYRWDLLTDLCYFSFEVDPATGNASTIHDFMVDPVIDTALANGVKIHLCVTLFSGHSLFFNSAQSQQTLIDTLISIVAERGIHGINIDFEAVPSSQSNNLTAFIQSLSAQMHAALPGTELSIASPAVNWNNTFDIPALTPWLDFYMVMTYDYYYGGSSLAGPVSGFWPMTSSFNYSISHSITYYQSQGVEPGKLLMGVPYYGREWPVESNTLPAQSIGSGVSLTYRQIAGGGNGNYIPENLYWDYRSYNPYYSYYNSMWNQCFFDNTRSLTLKYNAVNRRSLAGIGIWALGYDNGRDELWNLIEEKFTGEANELCRDTLYDNGGPWWSYKQNESYIETIRTEYAGPLSLVFNTLSLEAGFDSLWIYDGASITDPLLAAISGTEVSNSNFNKGNKAILTLSTTSNVFTVQFKSDSLNSRAGYELVWSCPVASDDVIEQKEHILSIFPNPAVIGGLVSVINIAETPKTYQLLNAGGKIITEGTLKNGLIQLPENIVGFFILRILCEDTAFGCKLIIVPEK